MTDTLTMLNAGLSFIPVDHKTKKARGKWKQYQTTPPTRAEVESWQRAGHKSYAVIGGAVSGGLEVKDFDDNAHLGDYWTGEAIYRRWYAKVGDVVEMYNLPVQWTPGEGYQCSWRRESGMVAGNRKLAHAPDDAKEDGRSVAIETRGEGGYALVPGSLHPNGGRYKLIQGQWPDVPTLPDAVADLLIETAKELDEMPHTRQELAALARTPTEKRRNATADKDNVIATFNARNSITALLENNGYIRHSPTLYSRPGKPDSKGMHIVDGVAFCWSSNDPLHRTNGGGKPLPIDAFEIHTLFRHNGDHKAAFIAAKKDQGLWDETSTNGQPLTPDEPPEEPAWMQDDTLDISTINERPQSELRRFIAGYSDTLHITGPVKDDKGGRVWTMDCIDNPDHAGEGRIRQTKGGTVFAECDHEECYWTWRDLKDGYLISPTMTPQEKRQGRSTDVAEAISRHGYTLAYNGASWRLEVNSAPLHDGDLAEILTRLYDDGFENRSLMVDTITAMAHRNSYHPVRDYLNGLEWDGDNHIGKLASHFTDSHPRIVYDGGKSAVVFNVWLGRWLVGAVSKVLSPADRRMQNPMLVLDGAQGIGKSYLPAWLCRPIGEHFREAPIQPDSKDSRIALSENFIWEVMELGATVRKADREALKGVITLDYVDERAAYGRYTDRRPTMASFIGTINNETGFLNDPTGSRRFLTVNLTAIDWAYSTAVDVNQVWAQAVHMLQAGATTALQPVEDEMRKAINGGYEVESNTAGMIVKLFNVTPDADTNAPFTPTVSIVAAMQAAGVKAASSRSLQMDVAQELLKMNAAKGQKRIDGTPQRGYFGVSRRVDNEPV